MLKKITYLLNKRDKRNLVIIFFIILISALLDLVGISAILPIIELLEKGESVIETNKFLGLINSIFKFLALLFGTNPVSLTTFNILFLVYYEIS